MRAGRFYSSEISLCGFDSREPFSWKHDACAFEIYYLVYSYSITLKLCYIRSRVSPTYRPCIIQNLEISALSPSFCDLPGTSEDPSVAKTNRATDSKISSCSANEKSSFRRPCANTASSRLVSSVVNSREHGLDMQTNRPEVEERAWSAGTFAGNYASPAGACPIFHLDRTIPIRFPFYRALAILSSRSDCSLSTLFSLATR